MTVSVLLIPRNQRNLPCSLAVAGGYRKETLGYGGCYPRRSIEPICGCGEWEGNDESSAGERGGRGSAETVNH